MPVDFVAVGTWLALYLALGAVALPLAGAIFARLVDRGAGLALPLALATLAVVGYWVGRWRFGAVTAVAGVLLLLALSGVALARGVEFDWRRYLDVAAVFALAYLLMVAVRAVDPGAWPGGGEKFLDFGLLASLLRAGALPPEDMWFAGEPVQYYYGGHMLAALLAELTGTAATVAYNLALAGYYAAFVAAAYGLAGTVAAGAGRSYRAAGAGAAFLVALASNLAPPIRLLAWALPWDGGQRLLEAASLERKGLALGPGEFNYWFASRVVDWKVINGDQWNLINEFPFFAFLNGDMHAHMMSPPFLLLVAGLGYAYWRTPPSSLGRRRALLALAAPVAGLLVVVNTWSFPAAVGLVWLALLFAPAPPWELLPGRFAGRVGRLAGRSRLANEGARVGVAALLAAVVGLLGAAFVLPFLLGPASPRDVGLLPTPRSDLPGLLVVHGAFLGVSVAYLLRRGDTALGRWLERPRVWALFALFAVAWLYRATAVALFLPPLLAAWWRLRGRDRDALDYEAVLLVGVLGLLLVVEFAYVVEQAGPGRSNTVFKVYAQVWALWSVAAGAMLPAVVDARAALAALSADLRSLARRLGAWSRGDRVATDGSSATAAPSWAERGGTTVGTGSRLLRREHLGTGLAVLLVLSLSIYPAFGLAWQFENNRDSPTLDARAFVADQHPGEVRAIEWLAAREGQPHIVSAPGVAIYQWVNGPSSLTGLPTVAGWAHEIGYRGRAVYEARVRDVNLLYEGTPEARAALLKQYDVRYVYVGPVERERYPDADLQFADEPGISIAFEGGDVTIYEVDRQRLLPTDEESAR